MEKLLDPTTTFREKNDDLSLVTQDSFTKNNHFVCVRVLIVRDILSSKDAQCNSEESP